MCALEDGTLASVRAGGAAGEAKNPRDPREVIREEQLMRRRILAVLKDGPRTIPEIAETLGYPTHEVVTWVMGMRKYGQLSEVKEPTEEGFYLYQALQEGEE